MSIFNGRFPLIRRSFKAEIRLNGGRTLMQTMKAWIMCARTTYGAKFRYVPARLPSAAEETHNSGRNVHKPRETLHSFRWNAPGAENVPVSIPASGEHFSDRRHGILTRANTGRPSNRPGGTWYVFDRRGSRSYSINTRLFQGNRL